MSHFFAKPENALKRAEELIAVGQKPAALQALHDVITSKRHRNWQAVLEKIIVKYIDLCVELRKGKMAKDGLIQYRMICQQTNVASLELAIRHFLNLANERAKEAQSKADQTTIDIEDLEAEESPESLMLSAISGETQKDRSDRELVTPWLKFLWETYRTVLEILRHNVKLESVYQDTAKQAFEFCKKYKRNTEFRRLCEILRTHLANLSKYANQPQNIALTSPESMQAHLETRFEQLNTATDLELWQEAYRSIEDIHGLMSLAKKAPKPQQMMNYYQKLVQIFWVSDNLLFHAYALYKLYSLQKAQSKTAKPEDLAQMASQVLLAALSIPLTEKKPSSVTFEFDVEQQRNMKMATLMGFSNLTPKRENILAELISKNILGSVPPQFRELYNILEVEFHPLDLAQRMKPTFTFLSEHATFKTYLQPLEKIMLMRVLTQLSQVYETMKISEFQKIASFVSFQDVEKFVVEAVRLNHLHLRIDHQAGTIVFGHESMEADKFKGQLVSFAKSMQTAVALIQPAQQAKEKAAKRKDACAEVLRGLVAEHRRLLTRKAIIEKRKEEMEKLQMMMREEEEKANFVQAKMMEDAEAKRLEAESRRRELERIQKEREMAELEEKRQLAEEIAKKQAKKGKGGQEKELELDPLLQLDKQQLRKEQLKLLSQDKIDQERKMISMAKRMDHIERARREEERPLLEQAYEEQKKADYVFYEEQLKHFLETHKRQHEHDLAEKQRLLRVAGDKDTFEAQLNARRMEVYQRRRAEAEERASAIRAKKAVEAEARRRAEEERLRREEEENARREAEEEERRRRREEEEREREEAAARRRAEDEERRRRDVDLVEARRRREEEAEARQREVAATREPAREERGGTWRAGAGAASGGSWRDRERERMEEPRREEPRREEPRASEPRGSSWVRPVDRDLRRDDRDDRREEPRREEERPAAGAGATGGKYVPPSLRRQMGK
eukprot:tig00000194_g14765.t1